MGEVGRREGEAFEHRRERVPGHALLTALGKHPEPVSLGLVSNIESRIVIRSVKNATAVPLGLVSPHVGVRV